MRISAVRFVLALISLSLVCVGWAQHGLDVFEKELTERQKRLGFPGVNIAVVWKDGRTRTISTGSFEAGSSKSLKPTDRMLAGSIGKTFVAAAFLQVAKEQKLDLDAKVATVLGERDWYPEIPNAAELTFRHLMTHTSGIPEHVQSKEFTAMVEKDPAKVWKYEDLLSVTRKAAPLARAGERFSYADTNYIVLGLALEKLAGKPMYKLVEERFLKPLKLDRTMPSDKPTIPDLAVGTATFGPFFARGPMVRDGKMIFNPQMEWCGGGFASTALDLAKWASALYGGNALAPELRAAMLKGVPAGPLGEYGLGVQIRQSPVGLSYGHGGWFPGWLSEMEYFPEHGFAVAVQFNTDNMRQIGKSTHGYVVEIAQAVLAKQAISP